MAASCFTIPPWVFLALGLLCLDTRFTRSTRTFLLSTIISSTFPCWPLLSPAITFTVSPFLIFSFGRLFLFLSIIIPPELKKLFSCIVFHAVPLQQVRKYGYLSIHHWHSA